jgi:hypothetical protein
MYDHQDGIIEIGSDGAFDLSDKPKVMVPPVVPEAKEPKNEKKLPEEWEIKKERGNKAFSSGHFELAIECYTSALECPLVLCSSCFCCVITFE